jgi:hypothetical protein
MSKQQNIEFGLIAILVTAVPAYWLEHKGLLFTVIVLGLVTILIPVIFTPFTILWHKLSHLLSKVTTSVLLGLIFFLIVTPVGCFRRIFRKDNLLLLQFRKSNKSVLYNRDHTYGKDDLIHTF